MGKDTKISWTHHTFNPWVGCQRVSPGCEHCYAETYDKRVGGVAVSQRDHYAALTSLGRALKPGEPLLRWGPRAPRTRTSVAYWKQPLKWNREAEKAGVRKRVFCSSLADVFDLHESIDPRWRLELFSLIRQTTNLDWQLLTKRPENFRAVVDQALGLSARGNEHEAYMGSPEAFEETRLWLNQWTGGKAPPNVWVGTTIEDRRRADERAPHLKKVPAVVHFYSCEPLLAPVELPRFCNCGCGLTHREALREAMNGPAALNADQADANIKTTLGVDWVIVGGESGGGARPFEAEWARSIVKQCRAAGVPVFVKQMGVNVIDRNDAGFNGEDEYGWHSAVEYGGEIRVEELDTGYQGAPVRVHLRDRAGGDLAEWPVELRVREFPEVRG